MRFLSSLFGSRSTGSNKPKRGKQQRKRSLFLENLEGRQMMAIDIVFNFDLDNSGFFAAGSAAGIAARNMLNIAANTIEARLNERLTAIEPSGANSWVASFQNPLSNQVQAINNLSIGRDTIQIVAIAGTNVAGGDVVAGTTGTAIANTGSSATFSNIVASRGKTDGSPGIWGGGLAFDSDANWNFSIDATTLQSNEFDFLTAAFRGIFQTLGFNAQNENFTRWIDPASFSFYGSQTMQAIGNNVPNPPTVAPSLNNPTLSPTPTEFEGFWSTDVKYKFSAALGNDLTLMSAPFTLAQDPLNPGQLLQDINGDFVYVTDGLGNPLNNFLGLRVLPTSVDYAGLGDIGWNLSVWPALAGDNINTAYQLNAPNTITPSGVTGINGASTPFGFNFSTGLFKYERPIDVEFIRVDVDLSKTGGLAQVLTMNMRSSTTTPGLSASFRVFEFDPSTGEANPIVGLSGEQLVVGTSFSYQFTASGTYFIGISRPQNIYYDATDTDAENMAVPAPFSRALAVGPSTGLYNFTGFFGVAQNYSVLASNIVGNVVATTQPNGRILSFGLTGAGQVATVRQPNVNDRGFFWTNQNIPGLVAKSFDAELSANRLAIASISSANRLEVRVWSNASSLTFRPAVSLPVATTLLQGARNVNATRLADGRFQVFFVAADNNLYAVTENAVNGTWSSAIQVASSVRSYDIFRNTNGIIDIFYLNMANGSLFTRRSTNTVGSAYGQAVALGGAGSQVLAVAGAAGQNNLMLLDAAGNLTVRTRPSFGAAYTSAVGIGVPPLAHISAGLNANGNVTIFGSGKNGNVYAITQTTANWAGHTIDNLQGAQVNGVRQTAVTRNQDGRLQFFAVGGDRTLSSRYQGVVNSRFFS